ncbi:hypothetical protein V6N11_054419 [Hibiscus sabdariffa]|uniref:Uncharacterized protein n=1 Tax=Hibiscus sabdariffa TaxID=183260 RepID=A0ABR2S4D7_9ROSI
MCIAFTVSLNSMVSPRVFLFTDGCLIAVAVKNYMNFQDQYNHANQRELANQHNVENQPVENEAVKNQHDHVLAAEPEPYPIPAAKHFLVVEPTYIWRLFEFV